MKVRIFMSCKWQGRIQKIPKGVGETLKKSQKKEWPQCPRPRPKSAHERCLKNCENKRQWTQHCNANNSFTTVFGCILNSSSENDSSEADSLLSDESFSSGRNSRQGDSENNTQRTSRRKKRKVCCFFKKINLPLSSPHRLLPFLDCNLVPRVSRLLLVNEQTLGTGLNLRLIVEIKSVNFALVFQVCFYCDVDVWKTQSFKTAICTLPKVCLIKFPGLFDGWRGQGMVCENPGSNNRKVLRL